MNTNILTTAARLSDEELLRRVEDLARDTRRSTTELVAHLAELARRKAHRPLGEGSLFKYCTTVLRLSEAATCNRLAAASAARRYPVILDLLAEGAVNLTTIRILAPHLTPENHRAVLEDARGKTKGEVEVIRARLAPRPDVPPSVRKLPEARPTPEAAPTSSAAAQPSSAAGEGEPVLSSPCAKPVVKPIAPARHLVQFTVGDEVREKLRRLRDLERRIAPGDDFAAIFERGLDVRLAEAEKRAFSATQRPRPPRPSAPGSRAIPAHVERAVWQRDEGQCAYAGPNGRCSERSFLEFHHVLPHAHRGEATVENISLRCRAHNEYESEQVFGPFGASVARESAPAYQ